MNPNECRLLLAVAYCVLEMLEQGEGDTGHTELARAWNAMDRDGIKGIPWLECRGDIVYDAESWSGATISRKLYTGSVLITANDMTFEECVFPNKQPNDVAKGQNLRFVGCLWVGLS